MRDDATEPDRKRRAANLVEILRDCIRRHIQLQTRLQDAGAMFRAEQDRQQFAEAPPRAAVDLFGQLLVPLLTEPDALGHQDPRPRSMVWWRTVFARILGRTDPDRGEAT